MPLGARNTHVETVRDCGGKRKGQCCANHREVGPPQRGEFARKCREHDPPLRVVVGGHEITERPVEEPAQTQGLEGHMARRRRHHHLAEYGEPLGAIGIFSDLFDKRDWIDYGKIAGGALLTASVAPKLVNLLNKVTFFGKFLPYAKGAAGVVGGFATYKYLGRRVPAKWRDTVVASAAVMAGLGLATVGHELLDTPSLKGIHGLGDIFPVSLANVGPDEENLLAALHNVEDAMAADMEPSFGDVFTVDGLNASVEPDMFNYGVKGLEADVDAEGSWALEDPNGGDWITGGFGGFDATVEPQEMLDYGEYDMENVQMQSFQ